MSQETPSDVKAPYSNAKTRPGSNPGRQISNGKEGGLPNRKKTTIRIHSELWAEFLKDVAEKDLSTCHVLEALISAWLCGGALVPGLAQPLQLNLTMQHVVARPRRQTYQSLVKPGLFPRMGEWVYNREMQSLVKVPRPHV